MRITVFAREDIRRSILLFVRRRVGPNSGSVVCFVDVGEPHNEIVKRTHIFPLRVQRFVTNRSEPKRPVCNLKTGAVATTFRVDHSCLSACIYSRESFKSGNVKQGIRGIWIPSAKQGQNDRGQVTEVVRRIICFLKSFHCFLVSPQ